MTAPTLFGEAMRPEPVAEGWIAELGLFTFTVIAMLGGGYRGSVQYGSRFQALEQPASPQAAAAECEAWLMRTMLETAGAMGFCLRRVEP